MSDAADEADPSFTTNAGWDRRRERVRRHLEDTAVELFAERGYENVSFDDIAEAAGVQVGTIYRYFPAKVDLLLESPRRAMSHFKGALAHVGHGTHAIDDVIDMLVSLSVAYHQSLDGVSLWHRATRGAPEVQNQIRGERTRETERLLLNFCADALGDDVDSVRVHAVAAAIAAVNETVVGYWAQHHELDLADLYREALDGLRHSLRPAAGLRPLRAKATGRTPAT